MFDYKEKKISRRPKYSKRNLRPLVLILGIFAVASLGIITIALLKNWSFPASAAPGIYKVLNYQGKLEDSGGVTVADGAYNIKFTIYDAAAAGNVLWSARESDACGAAFNPAAKSVTTSLGVFSTQLGESGDCPLNLDFNSDSYYLGVTIGADSEMTPRKRIGASGYAFNADLLDGLNTSLVGGASSFVPATDASGNLVLTANVTFDTNTFFLDSTNDNIGIGTASPDSTRTLDLTTAKKYGVYSVSSYAANDVTGVYGETSSTANVRQYGVYGTSAGPTGHGVHGAATGTGNPFLANYGGYFTSAGDGGYGVYGEASATGAVTNIGGYFLAQGDTGYAVRGLAMGMGGVNYGGYFRANGPGGYGVYGYAADTSAAINYGGYFTAAGTAVNTAGVYGSATNTGAGTTSFGGYFTSAGGAGGGVYGEASATGAVTNVGVYGTAAGDTGWAVSGVATGTAGVNYGGKFRANGPGGYGVYGYAADTSLATNYGGYFRADGSIGRAVYGAAVATGASANYGGYFTAAGTGASTSGVRGEASGTGAVTNYGGYFSAAGDDARGVYGEASASGAVTNFGGYFTAAGNTGYGVYAMATSATGPNIGGFFQASGTNSYGVYAAAPDSTALAVNFGGYFVTNGVGTGSAGVKGLANGGGAVHGVYGEASDTGGGSANAGGYFVGGGQGGAYGVYANATGAGGTNYGIYAKVTSAAGWAGYFSGGNGLFAERLSVASNTSGVAYNTIGTAATNQGLSAASDLFIAGKLEVDGASYFDGGHTDLAEMVAYSGEGEAGDVIVVDENKDNAAKLATKPYDQSVLGIISTKPSLIITGDIKEGKFLAIAGRVPTKVTNINGAIHRGDLLTTSSIPGHAMKATEAGPIVGKALGECDERECNIWVFLNVSWYGGM